MPPPPLLPWWFSTVVCCCCLWEEEEELWGGKTSRPINLAMMLGDLFLDSFCFDISCASKLFIGTPVVWLAKSCCNCNMSKKSLSNNNSIQTLNSYSKLSSLPCFHSKIQKMTLKTGVSDSVSFLKKKEMNPLNIK